jgi:hypothetical protein
MEKETRFLIRLAALLVLLALVTYLAAHRKGLTFQEAEVEAGGEVVELRRMVLRDGFAMAAALALVALFGFVAWTVLRPKEREDKAAPQGGGAPPTDGGASRPG